MAIQDYLRAQKFAEKQYRQAVSCGAYPYLPVLEDILRQNEVEGNLPMGQFEIPISMIAGTAQSERTTAFASNFMPLLDYDSEFGSKWSQLYDSVQEVGVYSPIKVYEYMQRFYVAEGNKRVSVSKYNGAVSILASVTRIVPKETDSVEYRIYNEFVRFYRIAGIYDIQMSQPDGFQRLLRAISPDCADCENPLPWNNDLRREVKFMYSVFENYYLSRNGQRLPITIGDAFLHFIEIYGWGQLRGLSSLDLHKRIIRVWAEFRVLADDNPTSRILNPTDVSKKVALTKRIPLPLTGSPVLHIAFLYPKNPESSAWVYNHDLGRRQLEDTFGDAIETKSYICEPEQAEETIEQAIQDGNTLIFTTSPLYHSVTMRAAVAHPDIILLNCSMNSAYKQLRTYYLRIYEAKFITGIIAGSMTENERIGYIADYPIFGTPASVSAFALGVKFVNPRAMVFLDWNTLRDHDPMEYFRRKQIDIISDRDISAPRADDNGFGLYALYGGVSFRLAMPNWNWGSLYEDLVHSVMIGAWKNDANQNETQALNYYWGMSSGAIEVFCSERLPSGTQKLVKLVQSQMTKGKLNPFTGPIFGQDGVCKVKAKESLTPDEIVAIDWLPDNVIGQFPEPDELEPKFQEFARWNDIHNQPVV